MRTLIVTLPLVVLGAQSALAQDDPAAAIRAAGQDEVELAALGERFDAAGDREHAIAVWRKLVELDPDHEAARAGLGHHRFNGSWYETYMALSKARRAEERAMLAKGQKRLGDGYVPIAEYPYRRMGWVQDAAGEWMHPAELADRDREAELIAKGWERQGHVWVEPSDFEKWRSGLYKVGEDWVSLEEANQRRSRIDELWQVRSTEAGGHFVALTTVDFESAQWVWWWADQAYDDLVRVFGLQPADELAIVCLNGIPQYNAFAGGDPTLGLGATEASGHSSLHYAYFADAFFDTGAEPPYFRGLGVCWWDPTDEGLKAFGQHAVRHAAAQSFVEAIDPSWDAVGDFVEDPGAGFSTAAFWAEKRVPKWLRYGAASYAERYFRDPHAQEGGDAYWARKWALSNLASAGGVPELEALFAFKLDNNDVEASSRLLQGAGAVVTYILDGQDERVSEAHAAFQAALAAGEPTGEAVADLEAALRKSEKRLRAFTEG